MYYAQLTQPTAGVYVWEVCASPTNPTRRGNWTSFSGKDIEKCLNLPLFHLDTWRQDRKHAHIEHFNPQPPAPQATPKK